MSQQRGAQKRELLVGLQTAEALLGLSIWITSSEPRQVIGLTRGAATRNKPGIIPKPPETASSLLPQPGKSWQVSRHPMPQGILSAENQTNRRANLLNRAKVG